MNRAEFLAKARQLLDELEVDHEEHTGHSDTDTMSWDEWVQELTNAYENE